VSRPERGYHLLRAQLLLSMRCGPRGPKPWQISAQQVSCRCFIAMPPHAAAGASTMAACCRISHTESTARLDNRSRSDLLLCWNLASAVCSLMVYQPSRAATQSYS